MTKIRDKLWIWGQTAGSHNLVPEIALPKQSHMSPVEGAEYFGIHNMCRVVYQGTPIYPYDEESALLANMKNVIWSIADQESHGRKEDADRDIEEVIRQAQIYPNVSGVVLDDFFARKAHIERYSTQDIRDFKRRVNEGTGRPLDFWMVIYTRDMSEEVAAFLEICDVISLWTWHAEQLYSLPVCMDNLKRSVGRGKRYMAGCYMWDYGPSDSGAGKPISRELMEYQLDLYDNWLRTGYIDGVIFCSNCTADIGLETSDMVRDWIVLHGDEEI
ncbi:hypothetical protein AGMMS49983_10890 [Clostridia bacterium]|nr:hypothetical protein AGMMS49983_10890 [Clostridia bacterium]